MSLPDRAAYALLGDLLAYPASPLPPALAAARGLLSEVAPRAAADLEAFGVEIEGLAPETVEQLYTGTFDLSPQCAPYLSVHLFGAESFERARMMTALAETFERVGFSRGSELPDHLAVVLRAAGRFEPEEWSEMLAFCLEPALAAMTAALEETGNPYRHLLAAVSRLVEAETAREVHGA